MSTTEERLLKVVDWLIERRLQDVCDLESALDFPGTSWGEMIQKVRELNHQSSTRILADVPASSIQICGECFKELWHYHCTNPKCSRYDATSLAEKSKEEKQ